MALASFQSAKSVVALSRSPLFHRQYSSVHKAIAGLALDKWSLKKVLDQLQHQWLEYFPVRGRNYWQTDVVNIFRQHSPCLRERQYRHKANNVIRGNKPIGIGYGLSSLNLADFESSWSVPFELRRIKPDEDEIKVGARQIRAVCQRPEFASGLNLNAADSAYGTAKYICRVNDIGNLVNVVRLRHGRRVFEAIREESTGGAPRVYGQEYYLTEVSGWKEYRKKEKIYRKYQHSIYERVADEYEEVERKTHRGRELKIELRRWTGMRMRSKNGDSMKEIEFDIVGIRVLDKQTGKRVFNEDVFAAVVGERNREVGTEEVAEMFYHRFDLEGTNRFMKQNLYLEGYQTPEVRHLDNWLVVVQAAMWLLWTASEEVDEVCEKWQKYSEPKRAEGARKTASQTRKGLERLISTFEEEPFQAKKCKKGMGRKKGANQEPRLRYKVIRKRKPGIKLAKPRQQQE